MSLDELRPASIRRRQARAAIRHELKTGALTLRMVFQHPPRELWDVPAYRIILWAPSLGEARLAVLNRDAIRARVNLASPVAALTKRERAWLMGRLDKR